MYDDILRAAIVLSVASMDAYFTDRFRELIPVFVSRLKRKKPGKAMVSLLKKAGLDMREALHLLQMTGANKRIRELVEKFLKDYTAQSVGAINFLFECLGIPDFCRKAEAKKERKDLLKSIEELVKRRHQIVHDGDCNTHGELIPITMPTVFKINNVLEFVTAANELLLEKEHEWLGKWSHRDRLRQTNETKAVDV